MALERPYTTVELVRAELLNADDDITEQIEAAINLASRYVEEYTNRDFWFHDLTTTPYKAKIIGEFVFLPWPVITLTEVALPTGVLDLAEVYFEGRVLESVLFRGKSGRVSVKGTFGYPITDDTTPPATCPAAIVRATTLIAASWSGEYKIERVGLDGQRQQLADNRIPSDAKALLYRYKTLVV